MVDRPVQSTEHRLETEKIQLLIHERIETIANQNSIWSSLKQIENRITKNIFLPQTLCSHDHSFALCTFKVCLNTLFFIGIARGLTCLKHIGKRVLKSNTYKS